MYEAVAQRSPKEALPTGTLVQDDTVCIDNEGMIKVFSLPVVTSRLISDQGMWRLPEPREPKQFTMLGLGSRTLWSGKMADGQAKAGSAAVADGLEPYSPTPDSIWAKALTEWVRKEHSERFG